MRLKTKNSVFEVNAIYFILLAEGFALLFIVLMVWILIATVRKQHKNKAIGELAARIKGHSQQRDEQTRAYLEAVYRLQDEDLHNALESIARHESEFYQLLVDSLYHNRGPQIGALYATLDKLIESYKCLRPRIEEIGPEQLEAAQELTTLRGDNEQLRSELASLKNHMSSMMSEFGNMFGGGKDHELALHEIKEKVETGDAVSAIEAKSGAQK